MAKKKRYDDDDGRTIADMSSLERTPMLIPKFPKKKSDGTPNEDNANGENDRPWENNELNKEERRSFILGAMSASALIALIFIIAGAISIALIVMLTK